MEIVVYCGSIGEIRKRDEGIVCVEVIPLEEADGYVKGLLRKAGSVASRCTIPVI